MVIKSREAAEMGNIHASASTVVSGMGDSGYFGNSNLNRVADSSSMMQCSPSKGFGNSGFSSSGPIPRLQQLEPQKDGRLIRRPYNPNQQSSLEPLNRIGISRK